MKALIEPQFFDMDVPFPKNKNKSSTWKNFKNSLPRLQIILSKKITRLQFVIEKFSLSIEIFERVFSKYNEWCFLTKTAYSLWTEKL